MPQAPVPVASARLSIAQLLQQGQACHRQGQWDLAATHYREIIERQPRSFEALHLLGMLMLQTGDAGNAAALLKRAAKVKPADAPTRTLLGVALQSSGEAEASVEHFAQAVKLEPRNAEYQYNLGKALRSLNRFDEACTAYESALRIRPDYLEALNNLSETLTLLGRHADALRSADDALRIKPDYAEALSNRGAALLGLNQRDSALEAIDQALRIAPNLKKALGNRGTVMMSLNRFSEARECYERALAVAPDEPLFHWNLAACLLLTGDFARGWRHYDSRWSMVLKGMHPEFPQPRWDGAPTARRVLVWGEQGLGDQILFASMFNEAAQRTSLTRFAVAPRLVTLFQRSFEGLNICTPEAAAADQAFDCYVCMGDLCGIFRPRTEDFLNHRVAYLKADPARTADLRREVAQPGTAVCGLSWLSNNKDVGREKSMALADLSREFGKLALTYVDLQYGDTSAERTSVRDGGGIAVQRVDSVDTFNDIDGLASLVDACDVIVTISNTTAHLAGALGKQVFLMLPYSIGRFWCWQADRSDALWYPNVRIFRQPEDGDWGSVLAAVRDALAALPPPASDQ